MTTYNFPNVPNVLDDTWLNREPLKAKNGSEFSRTVVVLASGVTADANARRLVPAGTVLCKITSGHGNGFYGPYTKTASDGRESLTAGAAVVASTGLEVTLGNNEIGGYYHNAVFDQTYIQDSGAAGDVVSKPGTSLTALKAAFPTCTFRSE